LLHAI